MSQKIRKEKCCEFRRPLVQKGSDLYTIVGGNDDNADRVERLNSLTSYSPQSNPPRLHPSAVSYTLPQAHAQIHE